MKFYRVSKSELGVHQGYEFATTKAGAARIKRAFMARHATRAMRREWRPSVDIDAIEVEPSRTGILAALNRYARHPNPASNE